MINIKGHVTIQVIDATTNEIVREIEQDNIITDITYVQLATSNPPNSNFLWPARNIFISDETATPVRSKTSIRCMGTASQAPGQPPITLFHRSNPPYFVITQRINANTGAPRTFNTVGLTNTNPGQFLDPNTNNVIPYAYLRLASPCIQETNQLLTLIYRITFDSITIPNAESTINPEFIRDLIYDAVTGTSAINLGDIQSSVSNSPLKSYNWQFLFASRNSVQAGGNTLFQNYQNNGNFVTGQGSQSALFYRSKAFLVTGRDNNAWNGTIVNGLSFGFTTFKPAQSLAGFVIAESDPGYSYSAHNYSTINTKSPMQSAFAYANPEFNRGPQFLPSNTPIGTGTVNFTDNGWNKIWPTIYRVRIVQSGTATTARYVLGVKNFSSFQSNSNFVLASTYRATHPYICNFAQPYERCHGWQHASPIKPLDDSWTIQADTNGISLINQFTGEHFDYDSTNGLNITNFRQFAFFNNFIYVACSATGLWRIDITNKAVPVITRPTTTPAYAVDTDGTGIVYVLLNTSSTNLILTSSASNYVTDLNCIALNTSQWINIYINKIHPDTRIAISVRLSSFFQNNTNSVRNAQLFWWSLAGGAASNVSPISGCGETQMGFDWVKNSDSRMWSGAGNLLVYGSSTSINGLGNIGGFIDTFFNSDPPFTPQTYLDNRPAVGNGTFNTSVAQDIWGNFFAFSVSGIGGSRLLNPFDGTQFGTENSDPTQTYPRLVALSNGIILSNICITQYARNRMDNALDSWIWYKWDGTNWIQSNSYNIETNTYTDNINISTESRQCSTTAQSLLDNINIRFTSGTLEPSFVAGEVYDQYVCKGYLKTNDTNDYLEYTTIYTQPVFYRQTITPQTINNTDFIVRVNRSPLGSSPDPLWHAMLPEYDTETTFITINGVEVTRVFAETIDVMPSQAALLTNQVAIYRDGRIICSTADTGKTITGYYSYVARSD